MKEEQAHLCNRCGAGMAEGDRAYIRHKEPDSDIVLEVHFPIGMIYVNVIEEKEGKAPVLLARIGNGFPYCMECGEHYPVERNIYPKTDMEPCPYCGGDYSNTTLSKLIYQNEKKDVTVRFSFGHGFWNIVVLKNRVEKDELIGNILQPYHYCPVCGRTHDGNLIVRAIQSAMICIGLYRGGLTEKDEKLYFEYESNQYHSFIQEEEWRYMVEKGYATETKGENFYAYSLTEKGLIWICQFLGIAAITPKA